jgi:predicted ATPase/DNA-binding CsgD family transcriptional regulator
LDLLEREPHLAQLHEYFRQAAAGHGRVVFLAGEAGVGKTALIDAFRQRIADRVDVRRFSCDGLSTPRPLGPIRDLASVLSLPNDPRLLEGEAREQLFRAILAALATRREPIVLIGEDAHWADGASIEFLRFLGRRIGDLPLLVTITYRDEELDSHHPLRVILGDLATAPGVSRMRVHPLSEEAVRQLADGSGRDAATLHRLTGGNPFFLSELLAATDVGVPATVGDAILARAARLSPEARGLLDVASIIGDAIDLNVLQRVAGPVLDEADACVARGLLHWTEGGLTFRHALVREAIFSAIAPLRRRLLHARVLAALREAPETQRDLALLAHHAEAAGDREAVLQFAIPAARQAAALHAHREAAAQYARALRFADVLPDVERADLFTRRSVACYFSDQGEEAIAAQRHALSIWHAAGDALHEGESLRWLSLCLELEGRGEEAETAATAARVVLEALPPGPELAMAYSNLAQLRMFSHDLPGTFQWGERAIALAERLGETPIIAHALINVGTARSYAGDGHGEEEIIRGRDLALTAGLVDQAGRAYNNLAWTTLLDMRLEDAERRFTAGIAYAVDHDLATYHQYLLAGQATLRVLQGAWEIAERELSELLQQPRLSSVNRIMALTPLARLQVRRGDPAADAALDEALRLAEHTGQLSRLGPIRAARADAALLAGDASRARAEALAASDLVFSQGNRWLRGEFSWLLWRAGAADAPVNGLAEPYALQIAGDAVGAAAAWQVLGCPYEAARALAESDDVGTVRRAIPILETLGARPALLQAMQRLRALGVRDLPPLRRGPNQATRANPASLTRREAEVLALVAEGLRNTEIAERLFLTPKTVGHHVSAIYAKLGVDSRTKAVQTAARLRVVDA